MNQDLSIGKPSTVLWRYCLPLFGSVIFQQLYNIADSLIAGKYINEDALAAVGNSYEVTLLFIAISFGSNIGCSVVISKLFGAKQYNDMKSAISTAMLTGLVICSVLLLVGFVFCDSLLVLIQTPNNIFADSKNYLMIYMAGFPFLFYYNISTGIFSALGDSKTPFYFLAVSSSANVVADIFFVTVLDMGVPGLAIATLVCQGISCVLSMLFLYKRLNSIETTGKICKFSNKHLISIARIAIPSILQQSFISVGNIIIQGAINSFGSSVTAAYSAAIKLNNLVITSFSTIGNGISNYTSQNLGAGKTHRISDGFKSGIRMVWLISAPIIVLYFVFGKYLLGLFLDPDAGSNAMEVGIELLRIITPFYLIASTKLMADGVLRGAGLMKQFMIGTFTDLTLRVALSLILSKPFGPTGIWISWPIGWTIAAVISVFFYLKMDYRKR